MILPGYSQRNDEVMNAHSFHTLLGTLRHFILLECISKSEALFELCVPLNVGAGKRIRYSDWLRPGWTRSPSSSPGKSTVFSFPRRPDRLWGPPSLLSNWYQGALSLEVERPGSEADHSPPTSAEVMNGSIHPFPIRLHRVAQAQLYH
jgi:hypothetical protein